MIKKKTTLGLFFLFLIVYGSIEAGAIKGKFGSAPNPPEGYSLVYMYRIKVPPGLRTPKVLVDGDETTTLPNNSYTWFYLSPGSHAIKTKWGYMAEVPDLEFVADIKPGRVHYLKMEGSVVNWGVAKSRVYTEIKEISEEDALADLEKVKKYSPAKIQRADSAKSFDEISETGFSFAPVPDQGYSLVYIYRPEAPPIMRRVNILVDDKEIIKLPNKGYSWFYLSNGNHLIKTNWGKVYKGVPQREINLDPQSEKTYYLRLSGTTVPKGTYDAHASSFDVVTEGLGKKEIVKLKKYIPSIPQKVD